MCLTLDCWHTQLQSQGCIPASLDIKKQYSFIYYSISAADEDGTQSSASDRYLSTCSTETETEPDGGAREDRQGKINEGSTGCRSLYERGDDPQTLPQEYAIAGASLPIIIDENDTNRKRKLATEGNVSSNVIKQHNLVYTCGYYSTIIPC